MLGVLGCASASSSLLLQGDTYVGAASRHLTERVCGRGFLCVSVMLREWAAQERCAFGGGFLGGWSSGD